LLCFGYAAFIGFPKFAHSLSAIVLFVITLPFLAIFAGILFILSLFAGAFILSVNPRADLFSWILRLFEGTTFGEYDLKGVALHVLLPFGLGVLSLTVHIFVRIVAAIARRVRKRRAARRNTEPQ
jgi:hypothetical protein